jgi:hypothetical protein
MSQANVRSIEVLRDFRQHLIQFAEEVMNSLGAVDMENRRITHWLTEEQKRYWEGELKRRKEKLSQAQAELFRRKLQNADGRNVSTIEQKDHVAEAKKRLEDGERRAALVKKWIPPWQQASLEYRGSTQWLRDLVGGDIARSVALLDRILDSLDRYTSFVPPAGLDVESFAQPRSQEASFAQHHPEPSPQTSDNLTPPHPPDADHPHAPPSNPL